MISPIFAHAMDQDFLCAISDFTHTTYDTYLTLPWMKASHVPVLVNSDLRIKYSCCLAERSSNALLIIIATPMKGEGYDTSSTPSCDVISHSKSSSATIVSRFFYFLLIDR